MRLPFVTALERSVALACAVIVLSGCAMQGLNFVQDNRVTITAPRDRAQVKFPVTVAWTVEDFEVTGRDGRRRTDAGLFGVYVDRAPQPPQRTQNWLLRDDPLCPTTPGCPNKTFLAERNIHSTTATTFKIETLPAPPTEEAQRRREFHEVTIALLNGRGERIGESAFTVEFEVDRGS
jgi:hypothetical protein